jgi:hypothetical protein
MPARRGGRLHVLFRRRCGEKFLSAGQTNCGGAEAGCPEEGSSIR